MNLHPLEVALRPQQDKQFVKSLPSLIFEELFVLVLGSEKPNQEHDIKCDNFQNPEVSLQRWRP